MRQRFGRSARGVIAPAATLLTALIVSAATAGSISFSQDRDDGVRAPSCDSSEGCAHISGYIKAGTDFPVRDLEGERPARIAPPPSGASPTGQAAADGFLPGMFPLESGRDQRTR
jgi:hypothetical protein